MAELVIIDDDIDVAWILQQLMEQEGHSVRVANNGEVGLRLVEEHPPDLVILDAEMPVLDGPTMAYRMFVHDVGLEDIPIVLISGFFDLSSIAHRVGTPYFLGKPFDPSLLINMVDRALHERALPHPLPLS